MNSFFEQPLNEINIAVSNNSYKELNDTDFFQHQEALNYVEQYSGSRNKIYHACSLEAELLIESTIINIANNVFGANSFTRDSHILGLDINQCEASAQFVMTLEEVFDVEVCDETALTKIHTVADTVSHIIRNKD